MLKRKQEVYHSFVHFLIPAAVSRRGRMSRRKEEFVTAPFFGIDALEVSSSEGLRSPAPLSAKQDAGRLSPCMQG